MIVLVFFTFLLTRLRLGLWTSASASTSALGTDSASALASTSDSATTSAPASASTYASPTASASASASASADTYEGREVAICDVGTAFSHADNNGEIFMNLRGKTVELLVQLEPTMYRKHVTTGPNGEPILHVRLLRDLYGLLRSALLCG